MTGGARNPTTEVKQSPQSGKVQNVRIVFHAIFEDSEKRQAAFVSQFGEQTCLQTFLGLRGRSTIAQGSNPA